MTLRAAHGTGAKALVRVETMPADELPLGVPALPEAKPDESPSDRGRAGRFAKGNAVASKGGKAKRDKTALAVRTGSMVSDPLFGPYRKQAARFRRVQCAALASTVGGGVCGAGPSSMVASAALALAASRYLYDAANGDPEVLAKAARLADSSRQQLLTAHELCAREATARAVHVAANTTPPWFVKDEE